MRGEPAEEGGIRTVDQAVAGVKQSATGPGEISDHVGRMILGEIGVDHAREAGRDDETLGGGLLGIAEQARPGQPAMFVMRKSEHLDRAGNAGRAAADDRRVERQRLSEGSRNMVETACAGATSRPS